MSTPPRPANRSTTTPDAAVLRSALRRQYRIWRDRADRAQSAEERAAYEAVLTDLEQVVHTAQIGAWEAIRADLVAAISAELRAMGNSDTNASQLYQAGYPLWASAGWFFRCR